MKKYFISAALITLIAACGGDTAKKEDSATTSETPAAPEVTDVTANPDYKAGLALMAKSDCPTCHKVAEKVIGPSLQDVANKYAGQDTAITYLTKKIIAGGSGVWGNIQMAPHPQLAQSDVEQIVKYILLLKTQ